MNVDLIISIVDSAKAMFGFPCTKDTLTQGERNVLKKLAVAYGKRASQMSDEELIDLYNNIDITSLSDADGDADDADDAEPHGADDADDADGEKDDSSESESESESEDESDTPPEYEPKNALEKEIVDIIRKVHPTLDDGCHDGVNEKVIVDLIEKHGGGRTVVEIPKPSGAVEFDGLMHEKLPQVLKALIRGDNVLLVGGAGSGKTTMATQLTDMLGKAFDQDDINSVCQVLCSKLTK